MQNDAYTITLRLKGRERNWQAPDRKWTYIVKCTYCRKKKDYTDKDIFTYYIDISMIMHIYISINLYKEAPRGT